MSETTVRRLARAAFLLVVVSYVGSVGLTFAHGPQPVPSVTAGDVLFSLLTAAFPIVAILILARQPRNPIGWILMAIAFCWAEPFGSYGTFALSRGLPGGALSVAIASPLWAPAIGLMGTSLILRFPDGRFPSPRWRKVEWLSAIAISATTIGILLAPGDLADSGYPNLANPIGVDALKQFLDLLAPILLLIPLTILASAVSLVQRFRRSSGTERLQLKWLTTAAALVALVYLLSMVASIGTTWGTSTTPTWVAIIQDSAVISFVLIPIAIGIAALKYHLYDIDIVINKTVVFATLAAFITAVYVAIVVGIGQLFGRGDAPNLGLSILATATVAFAFQPVRERVQHLANRLVYGERATPYEVMADLSHRLAEVLSIDDVLPRMAEAAARAVHAGAAEVRVLLPDGDRRSARWPVEESGAFSPDSVVPVTHGGEAIGEIAVVKAAGEPLTPAEAALLDGLASQAGVVLRNVRLATELRVRVEQISRQAVEIRASRQRLVTARDEERRRLERRIHGSAQRRLVEIAAKLRLAEGLLERDPERAFATLQELERDATETLEDLRDVARGIYPPLLADKGLVAALDGQARKALVPVEVHADGVGRYPQEVEATAYFCCLQALQNATEHASAGRISIRLEAGPDDLMFEVRDDGIGFDAGTTWGIGLQGMADRVAALGGRLDVRSAPGEGTTVTGLLPIMPGARGDDRLAEPSVGSATRAQDAVAAVQASSSRSGPNADFGM